MGFFFDANPGSAEYQWDGHSQHEKLFGYLLLDANSSNPCAVSGSFAGTHQYRKECRHVKNLAIIDGVLRLLLLITCASATNQAGGAGRHGCRISKGRLRPGSEAASKTTSESSDSPRIRQRKGRHSNTRPSLVLPD